MKDTINYLKTIRGVTYSQGGVDCLTKAIEACEKQIPMMVTGHKHIYPNEYGVTMVEIECPNCGSCFEFESLRCYEPEYCDECGQKLDWED